MLKACQSVSKAWNFKQTSKNFGPQKLVWRAYLLQNQTKKSLNSSKISDAGTGGARGATAPPQYLPDHLTLFQTGRADYPHLLLLAPPNFFTFLHHYKVLMNGQSSNKDEISGILLPKLFWPTVRKNCSSDREKLL